MAERARDSVHVARGFSDRGDGKRTTSRWAAFKDQLAIANTTWTTRREIRRDLGLSGIQDLQGLIKAVATRTGKPINVRRHSLPLAVSAMCARGEDRDFILIDSNAAELTQLHAILHELFHLWDDHPSDEAEPHPPLSQHAVQQLFPGLNPGPVVQVLCRSHYAAKHERRAEAFATVMLRHITLTMDDESVGFVSSALAHRRSGV
ncbi:hypothetical protein ABZ712_31770 [Streptomyces sp. NPDC006906]|uniref:hypothetical protein n=1 Tax=unclassified Streptomyces TaxID=2593676 RepID=UPI0034081050